MDDWIPNVTGTITPARALADAGLTLPEIAAELGMTESQVARLPELADMTPTTAHDNRVEQSLYAVAVGGLVKRTVATGERGETVTESVALPDPKAAQAWLQARRPAQWGQGAGQAPPVVVIVRDAVELRARLAGQSSAIECEKIPAPIEPAK